MKTICPLTPPRTVVLQTRVCAEELAAIKKAAKKFAGGNLSAWLRHAAANYAPLTPQSKIVKLKKRKS